MIVHLFKFLDVFKLVFRAVFGRFVRRVVGQIVEQISGQIFDQIFGQGFDQDLGEGKDHRYSVQYYPGLRRNIKNIKPRKQNILGQQKINKHV